MWLRILLALFKTAVLIALYKFVSAVLELSGPHLSWVLSVARTISEVTRLSYDDAVFLISLVITVSLFRLVIALGGVVSAQAQRPR